MKVKFVNPDNQSRSTSLIGHVGDNQVRSFSFNRTFLDLRTTFQIPSLDTNRTSI